MTAIILAGGKSSRIKTNMVWWKKMVSPFPLVTDHILKNKIFLTFGNETMLERRICLLSKLFKNIIVVVNSQTRKKEISPIVDKIKNDNLHLRIVCDYIKDKGSIGGLYSGLIYSKTFYNFITACDMPFLNVELLRYMKRFTKNKKYDAIVPFLKERHEPLFAFYSKKCIKPIEEQLKKGNLRITDFLSKIFKKEIPINKVKKNDPQMFSFFNINTIKDYETANLFLRTGKL